MQYSPVSIHEFKKAPSNRGLRRIAFNHIFLIDIIQKSPIKSGIKTLRQVMPYQTVQFKKAPSNRGLRRVVADFRVVAEIQKSPIKSGIKTVVHSFSVSHNQIQKSPIKSGIKTKQRPPACILYAIQKSPIKSGIKTVTVLHYYRFF